MIKNSEKHLTRSDLSGLLERLAVEGVDASDVTNPSELVDEEGAMGVLRLLN